MNEETLFSLLETVRGKTVQLGEKVASEHADLVDAIPDGFRNNIRWNLGHIAVVFDMLMHHPAGEQSVLPKPFSQSFAPNTSPSDWNEDTPTFQEVITQLREQPAGIKSHFSGRLYEPLPKPFSLAGQEFKTSGELLAFCLYHEGIHVGTINSQLKVLRNQISQNSVPYRSPSSLG